MKYHFLCVQMLVGLLLVSTSAWAQVAAKSGDLSFGGGYSHIAKGDNFNTVSINRYSYGGSGGYNLSEQMAIFGEYTYLAMPTVSGVKMNMMGYGGGARLNFTNQRKLVPFAVTSIGGARLSGSMSRVSTSANGYYIGGGVGANLYLGQHLGIRPEFRINYYGLSYSGVVANTNAMTATANIFYQFGGESKKPATRH